MENEIIVYTDGSCLGNPGPGGWAAIIMEKNKEKIAGGEKETTNNRMEMMAVIEALKFMKKKYGEDLTIKKIHFFIDSNLIVQTLTAGWKKKMNKDLWAEIERLSAWLNIKWDWIKAHHEDKYNIEVDKMAQEQALGQKRL